MYIYELVLSIDGTHGMYRTSLVALRIIMPNQSIGTRNPGTEEPIPLICDDQKLPRISIRVTSRADGNMHLLSSASARMLILLAATVLVAARVRVDAFLAPTTRHFAKTSTRQQFSSYSSLLHTSSKDESPSSTESKKSTPDAMDPLTKTSWYAVEAFGKIFGASRGGKESQANIDFSNPPQTLNEAARRIDLDNERSYFLSGAVDVEAYEEDCIFADPFVSFSGRQRFVDNLANLGSFVTEYECKMLKFDVSEDGSTVDTKVMVKLELNLPWKPILAWPWGVRYTINPTTCLITKHEESWDIEPLEGVKQIFRKPTAKINSKDKIISK